MPPVNGQRILISAASTRATSLQCEFSKCNHTAIIKADSLASDNPAEVHSQLSSAFNALGHVDLFVVDTRTHSHVMNPIWDVSLNEWEQGNASRAGQRRILLPVKLFLQHQIRRLIPLQPFSIVVLGNREICSAVELIISKLDREVRQLHQEAFVSFVDLDASSATSEQSITEAVQILVSKENPDRVLSLDAVLGLRDSSIPASLARRPKAKIALSFDFDALSAFLGTGDHPDNNMSDYSTGIFSGNVGARRLLRMLNKHQIADKVTWFIPGHTMETFKDTAKDVVQTGAEIGLHGYAHEGAYQMTPAQERDVLVKCMQVAERLTGKRVKGYRAPMYQLRETTVELLKEFEFLYDTSLNHHDCQPYFTPTDPPVERIDFSQPASSWLRPTHLTAINAKPDGHALVEIPTGWNNEDMMAMQYFPHLENSGGHTDTRVVEQRWKDMFLWFWEHGEVDPKDGSFVFPILMHPDTSGMAHVISMADRFVGWLKNWGDSVQFCTHGRIAQEWLEKRGMQ